MWPLSRMGLVWGILERHVVTCVEKYPIIKPVPTSNLLQGLLSPLGSESLSESLYREHYISSCGVLLLLCLTILVYQGSHHSGLKSCPFQIILISVHIS